MRRRNGDEKTMTAMPCRVSKGMFRGELIIALKVGGETKSLIVPKNVDK